MKRPIPLAIALIFALATSAVAGARVLTRHNTAAQDSEVRHLNDHPLAQPVANPDIKIEISGDSILRSCCKPPDLIVSGKVTNITPRSIDWVRLIIAMKDAEGRVVYTEDTYNHGAVTMFEDPALAKLLNDKPHFDRLGPGASDKFVFMIPMTVLPRYDRVLVMATDVVHDSAVAKMH